MNQKELDKYYLKVANVTAENSKAVRLQVGAILVRDGQIISDGFNGTPSGFDNNCENIICSINAEPYDNKCDGSGACSICTRHALKTKPEVLHAEANAITKCAKYGNATNNSTIYITHCPCVECSKLIIQAGIRRVVYGMPYRDMSGPELLKKSGIIVEEIEK